MTQAGIDDALVKYASPVISPLSARGLTFVTAESCAAGLVSAALSQAEGAATALHGSLYTKENNTKDLGVAKDLLQEEGSVTAEVAEHMACGTLERSSANIALSVSGVLDPDKDEDGGPSELGYIACCGRCSRPDMTRKQYCNLSVRPALPKCHSRYFSFLHARGRRMLVASYNVNGVNGRLPVLLRWLKEAQPDIVCLQELKAPEEKFPKDAIEKAGYGAVWSGQKSWNGVAILARGRQPIEIRRGLPGSSNDPHSRYIEADVRGIRIGCLYLPNGNPAPGPKFDYKLDWFSRLCGHAQELLAAKAAAILAGDYTN